MNTLRSTSIQNKQLTPARISVVGIDGAGKSTAARRAQIGISQADEGFSSLEISRELHIVRGGEAFPVRHGSFEAASRIDGKDANIRNLARHALARASIERRPGQTAGRPLSAVVSVRNPLIDSYVFAKEKVRLLPSASLSLKALKRACRTDWPNAVVWIDVDPDCALERIQSDAAEREQYGEQVHENAETLHSMRGAYAASLNALTTIAPTHIVVIDGSRPIHEVSDEVQDVLACI